MGTVLIDQMINFIFITNNICTMLTTVNDDSCSMFLIIIINGAPSICVCFNHNVYVSLLEVIINESLQMLENNKELMTPIMTHIKYRHLHMMTFRWYTIYENRGISNSFCMECSLYCLLPIKQINFYHNGGIQVGMLKLSCKIFEISVDNS